MSNNDETTAKKGRKKKAKAETLASEEKKVETKEEGPLLEGTSRKKKKINKLKESEEPICVRIKAIRETLGITMYELARRLNFSGPAISDLEKGKFRPGHDFYFRIYHEFKVNLYYLLFGLGPMFLNDEHMAVLLSKVPPTYSKDENKFRRYFDDSPLFKYDMLIFFRHYIVNPENRAKVDNDVKNNEIVGELY